jgi:hypothetical protein
MPYTNIYRYRLTSTGSNSQQYGSCEICGKPCSEVFMQSSDRLYDKSFAPEAPQEATQDPNAPKGYGWASISTAFGHRECLEAKQQGLCLPLTLEQFREHFCTGREFESCRNGPCQYSGEVCQHPQLQQAGKANTN